MNTSPCLNWFSLLQRPNLSLFSVTSVCLLANRCCRGLEVTIKENWSFVLEDYFSCICLCSNRRQYHRLLQVRCQMSMSTADFFVASLANRSATSFPWIPCDSVPTLVWLHAWERAWCSIYHAACSAATAFWVDWSYCAERVAENCHWHIAVQLGWLLYGKPYGCHFSSVNNYTVRNPACKLPFTAIAAVSSSFYRPSLEPRSAPLMTDTLLRDDSKGVWLR